MIARDSDASKKFYRTVIILKPFLFDYNVNGKKNHTSPTKVENV